MDPSSGYPLQTTIDNLTPPKVVAANTVNLANYRLACWESQFAIGQGQELVFAEAGLAKWYSPQLSRLLISAIYLHGIVTVCILITSYIQQLHLPSFQTHPWRKLP
ncbi:hypothetical protein BCR44DRAFT_75860, partial [Catenaria anguillulae PL171]